MAPPTPLLGGELVVDGAEFEAGVGGGGVLDLRHGGVEGDHGDGRFAQEAILGVVETQGDTGPA